jgi:ABC-2 type transport system permease protein
MNKILLIIKREYITRVRNKTFLLSTFLLPIMMMLLIFGAAFFAGRSAEEKKRIAIANDPGYIKENLKADTNKVVFVFDNSINDSNFLAKGFDGVLFLNSDSTNKNFLLASKKTLGTITLSHIESKLDKAFENRQLQNKGIKVADLDSISKRSNGGVTILNKLKDEKGQSKSVNASLNTGIGTFSGILIYMTMFIFGAMVMRGVMEEKTNRIAEVMVSSIKPFQLMMGKIIGIGAVGLTQLLLWIILISALSLVIPMLISSDMTQQLQQLQQQQQAGMLPGAGGGMAVSESARKLFDIQNSIAAIPWFRIIGMFVFYFLGGYLFYSSLFAAIGSVINEDPQEAQSLMLPITMPIIFGFIIMTTNINTPDSPAMVWGSIIPFTSPIVMMGRIAGGVPFWQLAISMILLIGGFLFTTWMAGKIYRTGILMYGKKASWKEMWKWAFRKQ